MKKNYRNYLWLKVELDEYELPLKVADSARELAQICGVTLATVLHSASAYKRGLTYKKTPYISVALEKDDEQVTNTTSEC